jgi:hypothetical protein
MLRVALPSSSGLVDLFFFQIINSNSVVSILLYITYLVCALNPPHNFVFLGVGTWKYSAFCSCWYSRVAQSGGGDVGFWLLVKDCGYCGAYWSTKGQLHCCRDVSKFRTSWKEY